MFNESYHDLADALIHTAQNAGDLIMRYRNSGTQVNYKADDSPVTEADKAAEELILNDLARHASNITAIGEESAALVIDSLVSDAPFFLVDALDGTRAFIKGGSEFTINIALIENRRPSFGLVYAPAIEMLYVTLSKQEGIKMALPLRGPIDRSAAQRLRAKHVDPARLVALASRSHLSGATQLYLDERNVAETVQLSSSLKFGMLANGEADLYPRLAPTYEWDTAAGHAILLAAGGEVVVEDGSPLTYGKVETGLLNPAFIAWGHRLKSLDTDAAKV